MKCNVWLWKVVKKKKNKVGTWGSWIPNTLTSCPFGPNLLYNFSLYIDLCNNQRCFALVIFSFFWFFLFSKNNFLLQQVLCIWWPGAFDHHWCIGKKAWGLQQNGKQNEMNICSFENSKSHQLTFKQWKFKK